MAMTTIPSITLEQVIWLKFGQIAEFEFTTDETAAVSWLDVEITIEADSRDEWQVTDIQALLCGTKPIERQNLPRSLFNRLALWMRRNDKVEEMLQDHVDQNMEASWEDQHPYRPMVL